MHVRTQRLGVASVAALLFLVVAAGATSGSPGDPLILGMVNNDAVNTNTGLATSTGGSALRVTQSGSGNALHGIATSDGFGVVGNVRGADGFGLYAVNSAATEGDGGALYARGRNNDGVVATTDSAALGSAAVRATTTGVGYAGWFEGGSTGFGVHAESDRDLGDAVSGISRGINAIGVYGQGASDYGVGIYGITLAPETGYAGFFAGPTYVMGDLTVTGTCTGCTVLVVALNGSGSHIEPGTALTVIDVRPPLAGSTPLLVVTPAEADDFVIGIMERGLAVETRDVPADGRADAAVRVHSTDGAAAPGGHLGLVMNGLVYAWVDAAPVAVSAGDLVIAGGPSGSLVKADANDGSTPPAVGYALESLDSGRALIAVLVGAR